MPPLEQFMLPGDLFARRKSPPCVQQTMQLSWEDTPVQEDAAVPTAWVTFERRITVPWRSSSAFILSKLAYSIGNGLPATAPDETDINTLTFQIQRSELITSLNSLEQITSRVLVQDRIRNDIITVQERAAAQPEVSLQEMSAIAIAFSA
jgi:hypothetical protein